VPNLLDLSKALFKVGDVEGHIISRILRRGLNFINGEVETYRNWLTFDTTKGKGTTEGYIQITYEDGSTIFGKFQGTLEPLKVKIFVGTSENALYIQIWTALM